MIWRIYLSCTSRIRENIFAVLFTVSANFWIGYFKTLTFVQKRMLMKADKIASVCTSLRTEVSRSLAQAVSRELPTTAAQVRALIK
jgi:hypothetical protein